MFTIRKTITMFAAILLITSCSLDEVNKSALTSDNYFTTENEFDELVTNVYVSVRTLLRNQQGPMWHGTDLYEGAGPLTDAPFPANDYTKMSGNEYVGWWWDNYQVITKANQALTRGSANGNLSADFFTRRKSELLALRAYAYFNLVESFGGVPLLLSEPSGPNYDLTRASEEMVYRQIVDDLKMTLEPGNLPDVPEEFGRVAQGFSNHLLAKVLLTRSYKDFAESSDLAEAIKCAEKALDLHPMLQGANSWDLLFGETDYVHNTSEIIFSVGYLTDQAYNDGGNNLYQQFKLAYDQFPGGGRVAPYWRCSVFFQPTAYFLGLYDGTDVRGSEKFLKRTIYAGVDYSDEQYGTIKIGDPIIYFPREKWNDVQKRQYMEEHPTVYAVVNPDEYHDYVIPNNNAFPTVWKFVDPGVITYNTEAPLGTRDTYIFRSAETLLLLAEAYVQQGKGDLAQALINKLRERAGASLLDKPATIDDVLDESARELFGEANRWMDLKRCGKLLERAVKYNIQAKRQHPDGNIPTYYLLRPIPLDEINISQGTLTQNPSYPEK